MVLLSLEDLEPGMIVAKPVFNHQGAILLGKGVRLSEKSIWILRSWGVSQIWIKKVGKESGSKGKSGTESRILEPELELRKKLSEETEDEVMNEILRAASQQIKKRKDREKNEISED
ncbi:MAG: hypothetical protein DRG25_06015 [Deltaproteobacteria bacterium]|nr:MAG: hypothetical protein DRG25_06015 [Deltaproteobacteria bacterium]